MLTRSDVEQILAASQKPEAHVGQPLVKQQFKDLCELALLALDGEADRKFGAGMRAALNTALTKDSE